MIAAAIALDSEQPTSAPAADLSGAQRQRDLLLRYGCAALVTLVTVGIRALLTPYIQTQFPFATVYFGVTFAAWYGGFGPALFAIALGYLGIAYFVIPPLHSFALHGLADWIGTLIYVFLGLSSALFSESLKRAQMRAEHSAEAASSTANALRASETQRIATERERENHLDEIEALNGRLRLAMAETHHRVKNNLQVIAAMIDMQTMEGGETLPREEFLRLSRHVRTLADIHDILTGEAKEHGDAQTLAARSLLNRLIGTLQKAYPTRRIHYQSADATLTTRQGTALALVANELISNAVKHGQGEIDFHFDVEQNAATLEVCDAGPGFPPGFDLVCAGSTGMELIAILAQTDLGGQISCRNHPEGGACVTIAFPLTSA